MIINLIIILDSSFKFVRLFTDRLGNDIAINFYKKNGYIFENYDCKLEELKDLFDVVIGSKSLTGGYVPKWNNKFIKFLSIIFNLISNIFFTKFLIILFIII